MIHLGSEGDSEGSIRPMLIVNANAIRSSIGPYIMAIRHDREGYRKN